MAPPGPREYLENELLAEIFGFLPTEITDYLFDSITAVLISVMDGIYTHLAEQCPEKSNKLAAVIKKYEVEVQSEMNKVFDTMQAYLFQNVFKIPDNLDVKPEYLDGIDLTLTQEHEDKLDQELKRLQQEIYHEKQAQHYFNKEIEKVKKELEIQAQYSEHLSFISTIPAEYQIDNVGDRMQYVNKHLEELKKKVIHVLQNYPIALDTQPQDEHTKFMRDYVANLLKQQQN